MHSFTSNLWIGSLENTSSDVQINVADYEQMFRRVWMWKFEFSFHNCLLESPLILVSKSYWCSKTIKNKEKLKNYDVIFFNLLFYPLRHVTGFLRSHHIYYYVKGYNKYELLTGATTILKFVIKQPMLINLVWVLSYGSCLAIDTKHVPRYQVYDVTAIKMRRHVTKKITKKHQRLAVSLLNYTEIQQIRGMLL